MPEDVAIAGFSNEVFTQLTEPALTTVDQRCEQMGRTAVQQLQKMLPTPGHKASTPRGIVLKPRVIVRDSSQR